MSKFKLENIFLPLVIICGFLVLLLTPPMAVPDENTHFFNSYRISTGDIFPDVHDNRAGAYLPKNLINFIDSNNYKYLGKLDSKNNFESMNYDIWHYDANDELVFYETYLTAINPIGYVVPSFGMLIGRSFSFIFPSLNLPYNNLLFGRIANLIVYSIITYIAIKNTGSFKRTMFLLSLMPMSLFLASSLSYDAILIPTSFFMFSLVTKLIKSDVKYKISLIDFASALFIAFIFGGVKKICLPFLLLFFLIPKEKFKSSKHYILMCLSVAIVALLSFAIPEGIINYIVGNSENLNMYVEPQKEYLFNHLGQVPNIILTTFKEFGGFFLISFFGSLGQLDFNFPLPFIIIYYFFLTYIILIDSTSQGITKIKNKMLFAFCLSVSLLGLFYFLYVDWTSRADGGIGFKYILGLQGRYFIPLVLFGLYLIENRLNFHQRIHKVSDRLVIIVSTIYSILTVVILLLRFW